jgi:hypothetical protein
MRLGRLGLVLAAAAAGGLAVAAGESIVGEWKLVEQTYGRGQANLVTGEPTLVLEFAPRGVEIEAVVRGGEPDAPGLSWPRFAAGAGRPIHVAERQVAADGARARYRVDPAPGDDLTLEVEEDYRLTEGGRALVGTVRVRFWRDGQERGGYTLERRFEKLP